MNKRFISKLIIVALLFGLIGTNGYALSAKADSEANGQKTYYLAPYTSVKDQNKFGSCWMFGSIASAESNLLNKTNQYEGGLVESDPINLSEAQGVACCFNADKDEQGTVKTYSSNDVRNILNQEVTQYLGYTGGAWPADAAMVMSSDKGSALESDNPFNSRNYPDNYDLLSKEEQTSKAESIKTEDASNMVATAASKYNLNRFNLKSAEELPAVYTDNNGDGEYEIDESVRQLWKEKIESNGGLSVAFFQARKDNEEDPDEIITVDNPENSNEEDTDYISSSLEEETVGEVSTTDIVKETSKALSVKNKSQDVKSKDDNNANEETTTKEDARSKYYHAWRAGDETVTYAAKHNQPNYWYFSMTGTNVTHVVCMVGYDDKYSKYNFAERLVNPDTNETREYNSQIADKIDLKETDDGKPDLRINKKGHMEEGFNPVYDASTDGPNQKHAEYIVPKDEGAWIVKDSHNTHDSIGNTKYDEGIRYLSYSEASLRCATSFVVEEDLDDIINYKKKHNATLSHSSVKGKEFNQGHAAIAGEVFTVDKDMDISEIGYWTGTENTYSRFRIYKNLENIDNPASGELVYDSYSGYQNISTTFGTETSWTALDERYIKDAYKGYHTLKIDNPIQVEEFDTLSVVVSQKRFKDDIHTAANLRGCLMMEYNDYEYSCKKNNGDTLLGTPVAPQYTSYTWKDPVKTNSNICNATVKLLGNTEMDEVALYKSGSEYNYPQKDGELFAGWYDDKEFTQVHTGNKGYAYARFIDNNVLKVKAQTNQGFTAIRFVSSLDNLDYNKAGFIINGTYNEIPITNVRRDVNRVYLRLKENGQYVNIKTKFCNTSRYFFAYSIRNMAVDAKSTWEVVPLYETQDGTTVIGKKSKYHLPYVSQ